MTQAKKRTLTAVLSFALAACLAGTAIPMGALAKSGTDSVSGGYYGRAYDANYDLLLDSFEVDTGAKRELTGDATAADKAFLEVNYGVPVGDTTEIAGSTTGQPVYKFGGNVNEKFNRPYFVLNMKTDAELSAKIADFTLVLGKDDTVKANVPFADLVDADGEALAELTGEYQKYVIDLAQIDGNYPDTDTPIAGGFLNFHILSSATSKGTLYLSEMYFADKPEKLFDNCGGRVDNFEGRSAANGAPVYVDGAFWWNGTVGKIIPRVASIANGSYTVKSDSIRNTGSNPKYKQIALNVRKIDSENAKLDVSKVSVTPVYFDEASGKFAAPDASKTRAWSDLRGPDGMVVPAFGDSYTGIVIDFDRTGWTAAGFAGVTIQVAGTGKVEMNQAFFTNMRSNQKPDGFPVLDAKIMKFDDFERDKAGAELNYDDSVKSNYPQQFGLASIIAWNQVNIDRLSIENGKIVFDCTSDTSYIQLSEEFKNKNDNQYEYAVFKMKATDGGSINNFRIQTSNEGVRSPAVWGNGGLLSDTRLPVPQLDDASYPYRTADGYSYIIVDLAWSGLGTVVTGLDIFFNGPGKLYIDEIFFANRAFDLDKEHKAVFDDFNRETVADNYYWGSSDGLKIEENALVLPVGTKTGETVTSASVNLYGAPKNAGNVDAKHPYLVIRMKADKGVTLSTLRIATLHDSDDGWSAMQYFDKGDLKTPEGRPLPDVTTEWQDFVIDLEASELMVQMNGINLWVGGWSETAGNLYIDEIYFAGPKAAASYGDVLKALDHTKPVITVNAPETAAAGDTVTVSAAATDDLGGNVTTEIAVTKDGAAVTLADGKFVAEEGTYTVTVTATDESGNTETVTRTIVVSAAAKTGSGCGCGTIGPVAGGIIGGMTLLLAAGIAVFAVMKASLRKKSRG